MLVKGPTGDKTIADLMATHSLWLISRRVSTPHYVRNDKFNKSAISTASSCEIVHRNGKVARVTVLVFTETLKLVSNVSCKYQVTHKDQRTRDAKITSLWRQNDVATSFWRHNDVIIASCARWVRLSVDDHISRYVNRSANPPHLIECEWYDSYDCFELCEARLE